jgi:hypothetical protein
MLRAQKARKESPRGKEHLAAELLRFRVPGLATAWPYQALPMRGRLRSPTGRRASDNSRRPFKMAPIGFQAPRLASRSSQAPSHKPD